MLFMKKYFSAENVFIFQIFLCVTHFFISIVFSFLTQYAYDFPKLNFILCLENKLKFLRPFKKYIRFDGGGRGELSNYSAEGAVCAPASVQRCECRNYHTDSELNRENIEWRNLKKGPFSECHSRTDRQLKFSKIV